MVTGARQVGKTTLIGQFGADHYEHVAEVNFIEMPQAVETVSKAKDAEDLILRLSVLSGTEITPGKTLLFLDEIQACEDMPTCSMMATWRLLAEPNTCPYICWVV